MPFYRISALSVDTNNEKSSHSVESAPVDYGQAGYGSPEENISTINITSRVQNALDEVFKLRPITNNPSQLSPYNQVTMSRSNKSVNGISSSRERNRANRDLGNCSGSSVFSNMSYLESATGDSLFMEQLSCDHYSQSFQDLTKSTEGQWSTSVSTEQALNACGALKFPQSTGQDPTSVQQCSWATSLHVSPIIQMESSYQCLTVL